MENKKRMIPENRTEAVKNALKSVFGTKEFDEITKITTGLSNALVFRIIVTGKPYLLRVITRTDVMFDPTNNYACMKAAADAGIAPKIWYMNVEARFSITDFIEAKAFPINVAREKLPGLLRKLHTLHNFPMTPLLIIFNLADTYIKKFRTLNIIPASETREIFETYEQITKVYPKDKDSLVSCHNDLKPENIIFDGDKPWLVDWETASLNNRYTDLSIVTNFLNKNQKEEEDFLERYFGKEINEYDSACFYLIQQIIHITYFTFFMVILSFSGKSFDWKNCPDSDYREFHDRIWKGEITLHSDEPRLHYALVHKKELQKNIRTERFKEAMNAVSKMKKIN